MTGDGTRASAGGLDLRAILLGGVVAGLILNASGMASAFALGLPESFARFDVAPTAATALRHVGLRLGLGVASLAVYAGMRSALGLGARVAVLSGLLVWFIGYVPGSVVLHEVGVLTGRQLLLSLPWGATEAVVATLAGARFFR